MSHVLVSVVAEVAANCYLSVHFQFSTSPDTEFHCQFHSSSQTVDMISTQFQFML